MLQNTVRSCRTLQTMKLQFDDDKYDYEQFDDKTQLSLQGMNSVGTTLIYLRKAKPRARQPSSISARHVLSCDMPTLPQYNIRMDKAPDTSFSGAIEESLTKEGEAR